MEYDAVVIGAGLSGLSAASLLAKRGLKVAVVDKGTSPGGSCGIFKRGNAVFDQGAAMLYGFGEHGFNAHRFLFNCLEEQIEVIKHELLYVVHYNGKKIRFWPDVERFTAELSAVFPTQKKNIERFYRDMRRLYGHVISENPSYTTPDETDPRAALRSMLKHPLSYLKFFSYMNISAKKLLQRYFDDGEILHFFDKLTSTYCYATVREAPAIMASVMFTDNHVGGSYYPAGSTLFLPGKLEKVIEESGGKMFYNTEATELVFKDKRPCAVALGNSARLYARHIIYSGTVWNLYGSLIPRKMLTKKELALMRQLPTYKSVVLYAVVKRSAIPADTCPIEMIAENPYATDESEITLYMLSIDDHTLCAKDCCTVIAIGPSFREWAERGSSRYRQQKQQEIQRITAVIEKKFPGFESAMLFCELATPKTIERYTMKNNGAVAGPKHMLGQHMLRRQTIATRWDSLFCCGESTTMGTGTPTVTTSGIAAANAVLKKRGLEPFVWSREMKNHVNVLSPPVEEGWMERFYPSLQADIMKRAQKCLYCDIPSCCPTSVFNIAAVMRRVSCGNFVGAKALIDNECATPDDRFFARCEQSCVSAKTPGGAVDITGIVKLLKGI